MPFLSPAKLLVVVVVAIVVLGPDKLPKVAHPFGSLWSDLRRLRARLETDVRESFPDLPSTEKLQQAVRSPLSFLDDLADSHAADSHVTPPTVAADAVTPAVNLTPATADASALDEGAPPPAHILAVAGRLGALHRQPPVAVPPADILAIAGRLGALHRADADQQTCPGLGHPEHTLRSPLPVGADVASLN